MLSTSAANSAIDSFHTAQEGSSICPFREDSAVWMQSCLMDEVTSRVSTQHPSNRQQHHANNLLQSLQPSSISVNPSQMTAGISTARPSKIPIRVPVKRMPLRTPPPETTRACKRLCTRAAASEPGTPDISPRQLGSSADKIRSAAASTAAAQPDQGMPVSPEMSGTQPRWSESFDNEVRDVPMVHTEILHAPSISTVCSLPSGKHSKKQPGELDTGQTSPTVKAQVGKMPEYSHLAKSKYGGRRFSCLALPGLHCSTIESLKACVCARLSAIQDMLSCKGAVMLLQAGGCQLRLAASAGQIKVPEKSAVSRRRLSFFAQLRRPAQACTNLSYA